MKKEEREQLAMRVSCLSIAVNILLSAFKLFAGIFARSGAMLSDAVHSLSDVFSTLVVIVGVKLSGRASDKGHPYGHERMECVAALLLAVILGATGFGIGYAGILKIAAGQGAALPVPGGLALAAALASVVVKEGMYWYTRAAAKKTASSALMADAWHHRSDAFSSVGSFAGILGARMGFPVLDPIASLVICFFIVKAAVQIFADAIGKMTDKACGDEQLEQIRALVNGQQGVLGIDQVKTRLFGDKIYVDVEISADGNATLYTAHAIAQGIHDAMEERFPEVKHCMVHVNPASTAATAPPVTPGITADGGSAVARQ